jgi:hypothetical protein
VFKGTQVYLNPYAVEIDLTAFVTERKYLYHTE